jgi:Holliday junction resolvase RusA-like endonuclease
MIFTIEGKPIAKQRPRLGRGGFYTPTKTKNYEKLVGSTYQKLGFSKIDGYIKATIKIFFQIPPSYPKRKKEDCRKGKIRPTAHGDTDNIVKAVLDGLNGIAYEDDCVIEEIHAEKWYAERDYVEVQLQELKELK